MKKSSEFPLRLLALLAVSCIEFAAMANDFLVPEVVLSKRPIDVHNMHVTQTAQVGVARFDIDPHTFVGSFATTGNCSGASNLSLDAYEELSSKAIQGKSLWSFDLANVQKVFAIEMENAGYPRYAPDLSLFETHLGSDPDFRTAVTFTNMQFDKCGNWYIGGIKGISYIKAKIEVFSQREQKVVLNKVFEAAYKVDSNHAMEDRKFNWQLLAQLADNLLADPEYAALFHNPASSAITP